MNIFFSFISVSKIIIITVLLIQNDANCQGSIRIWIITMLVYDILNMFSLMMILYEIINSHNRLQNTLNNSIDSSFRNFDLTFHSQIRRRFGHENSLNGYDVNHNIERHNQCTSYLLEFCRFCYLLLFLFGNVLFFSGMTVCNKGS